MASDSTIIRINLPVRNLSDEQYLRVTARLRLNALATLVRKISLASAILMAASDPSSVVATVSTTAASNVNATGATSGDNVTSAGGTTSFHPPRELGSRLKLVAGLLKDAGKLPKPGPCPPSRDARDTILFSDYK